jgi:flagellar export protein FliJ
VKSFRFRAATLLELRRRQERAALSELSRVQAVALKAAADRDLALEANRKADAAYCAALQEGADLTAIERHRNWIVSLQTIARARVLAYEERQREVEQAVKVAQLAHKQVRILERLRDRALRRHTAAEGLAESKEMDQFAASQFARRTVEGG